MLQETDHLKKTVVLNFPHIQCLHFIYSEVVCVLVSSGTQSQLQIRLDPDWLWDLSVYYWWKKGKFLLNLMYTIISWQNKLSWDIHRRGFIITTEKIIRSPSFLKPNCIYSVCFCCKTQDVISYCSQHA